MKTFSQFMAESEKKKSDSGKPHLEKDKDGFYTAFAVMGSHSKPKKKLKEDASSPIPNFKPWDQHSTHDAEADQDYHTQHVQPIHNSLSEHYKNTYTNEHVGAIHEYTNDSTDLNKSLIAHNRNKGQGVINDSFHRETINHLDDAMKTNRTPHALETYSGASHSPEHYPIDPETGKRHMHFPAFTSSSLSKTVANQFAKNDFHLPSGSQYDGHHVYRFHVPEGHPAMYLENHTKLPGEHELLLHRGMRAHVSAEPTTYVHKFPMGGERKVHVWDAHVLPHDGKPKGINGFNNSDWSKKDDDLLAQLKA